MAPPKKDEKEKLAPIIIKRIKKGGGGHHGGAWKVAYADFVTAMMAFFLLLWLLNVTTEEQKNAISNYFDPSHPQVSNVVSGAGGVLAGMTMAPEGAMVSTVQPIAEPEIPDTTTRGTEHTDPSKFTEQQLEEELRKKEDERFKQAEEQLKAEIAASPELKDLQNNLLIDITPEGLRIQIVDDQGRSMFPSGSAVMYDFMRQLLLKVTGVVTPLSNQVSIRGHTDSAKYKDPARYDNWNLSADRAQASRRVMVEGKLPETRVENVVGRADREHLVPNEPENARNRRISIVLLRERLTQRDFEKMRAELAAAAAAKPAEAPKPVPAQAAPATETAPAPGGLQIIDDTQPKTPPKAQPVVPGAPNETPAPVTPLPTTEVPSNFQRQPQVMYFGDAEEKPAGGNLYEGPTQSPFVNKPPTIQTPAFNLPSNAQQGATSSTPPVTPAQKSISFGEPVPAQTMPNAPVTLPAAPGLEILNQQTPKVFEFGGPVPQTAPAGPAVLPEAPELQIINPQQAPKVIEFGDAPKPAPAILPAAPDLQIVNPPASSAPRVLDFGTPAAPAPLPAAPDLEIINPKTQPRTLDFGDAPAPAPAPAAPKRTKPAENGKELAF